MGCIYSKPTKISDLILEIENNTNYKKLKEKKEKEENEENEENVDEELPSYTEALTMWG